MTPPAKGTGAKAPPRFLTHWANTRDILTGKLNAYPGPDTDALLIRCGKCRRTVTKIEEARLLTKPHGYMEIMAAAKTHSDWDNHDCRFEQDLRDKGLIK